jgi:hypothetical protein
VLRLLAALAVYLLANAVGLIVAAAVLDDMTLDAASFIASLVIFTAVEFVARPLVTKLALQYASALLGGTALVATLLGLVAAEWLSEGVQIDGFLTWALATVIVWIAALLANLVLPVLLLKRAVQTTREGPRSPRR